MAPNVDIIGASSQNFEWSKGYTCKIQGSICILLLAFHTKNDSLFENISPLTVGRDRIVCSPTIGRGVGCTCVCGGGGNVTPYNERAKGKRF